MKIVSLFLFSTLITFSAHAQIKTTSGKLISKSAMDQFLQKQLDSLKLPALSVAFINDGKIVYHRTLGIANVESGKKADDQSLFEAASLSKPVFAYLVMKMVEKGTLDLDKPLYQYLPFPEIAHDERYKLITARMVLSHTTGFPNWRWYDKADTSLHVKDGDMYMMNAPGTFGYSGEGYHYLAKVVAHLNGGTLQHLDPIFQKEVAIPLGMQHAWFSWNDYIAKHKVTGYKDDKVFGKYWPAASPDEDSTIFGSASTLHINAVNYAKFLIAIIEGKGLKKETLEEMLKQQSHIPTAMLPYWGEITGWSLGFAVEPTDHGIRYSHGGDNGGFQAGCMFYRKQKNGYVFFTNCDKSGQFYVNLRTFLGEMKGK
jgi:CubicO group peptidase (beta-lactamase class C family)